MSADAWREADRLAFQILRELGLVEPGDDAEDALDHPAFPFVLVDANLGDGLAAFRVVVASAGLAPEWEARVHESLERCLVANARGPACSRLSSGDLRTLATSRGWVAPGFTDIESYLERIDRTPGSGFAVHPSLEPWTVLLEELAGTATQHSDAATFWVLLPLARQVEPELPPFVPEPPVTTPGPDKQLCPSCGGRRACWFCHGARRVDGALCSECLGRGYCIGCDGAGEISAKIRV
ncbi:MAG: hypothetical protein R3B99_14925 [Polyangiales bacterium]